MHPWKRLWKFWRDLTTAWPFVPDLAHRAPGTHVVSGAWELNRARSLAELFEKANFVTLLDLTSISKNTFNLYLAPEIMAWPVSELVNPYGVGISNDANIDNFILASFQVLSKYLLKVKLIILIFLKNINDGSMLLAIGNSLLPLNIVVLDIRILENFENLFTITFF